MAVAPAYPIAIAAMAAAVILPMLASPVSTHVSACTSQKRKVAAEGLRRTLESGGQDTGMQPDNDVTGWLIAWGNGDGPAGNRLMAAVYEDLRRVARRRLRGEKADHSVAPTALVHEAYLKLVEMRRVRWQNRAQFFAIAARLMRQILVDEARRAGALKRGAGAWKVPLTDGSATTRPRDVSLLDLDAALQKLSEADPRLSDLVVLRFFGGLTVDEAAEVLGTSPATVKRDWSRARAWLFRELRPVSAGR